MTSVILLAATVITYALFSKRLAGTIVTMPLFFVLAGWGLGGGGLGFVHLEVSHEAIHLVAEITLVLVLFSDASRIDLKGLLRDHDLPQRMLVFGLPATVVLGALVGSVLFTNATWPMLFLLAAILAPTDAALGQDVVSNPTVPVRIRQAINVESGLNDGIALPLVLIFAIWAGAPAEHQSDAASIALFTFKQVTLGPLAGVLIGMLGAKLIDTAAKRGWMSTPFQGISVIALAILVFAAAEAIGGNGFIAAFTGGLVFGASLAQPFRFLEEFMETEGLLLTLLTFGIFGLVMVPDGLRALSWPVVGYAVLSLTIVRIAPVFLALAKTQLTLPTKLFLGWFGPRGLASILFALLILQEYPVSGADEILACVVVTVLLSTILHGATAGPFAKAFGRLVARQGECAETEPVPEMPLRHGNQVRADAEVRPQA